MTRIGEIAKESAISNERRSEKRKETEVEIATVDTTARITKEVFLQS